MPVTTLPTEFGGRTLTIETGKLAMLAGGSVTVRYGDTMRAWHREPLGPAPRARLLPAHGRLRGAHVRRGQDPGRFHQARVAPVGGGHPRRPPDRPAHPPALPRGLQGRRPDRASPSSRRTRRTIPTSSGTIAASAALTISDIPFHGPRRLRSRRPHQRRVRASTRRSARWTSRSWTWSSRARARRS